MFATPNGTAEDLHVHSTWSDGRGTLAENLEVAESLGLRRLGMVDHVRADTDWVVDFVRAVDTLRAETSLTLVCGVEAKVLDEAGALDLPADLEGVDRVYIADHRLPLGDACVDPKTVRAGLADGSITQARVVTALVDASVRAMHACPRPAVLAHWGSILPKVRVPLDALRDADLDRLAQAAKETGTWVELDERWQAPRRRVLAAMQAHRVPLVCSSDAHRPEHIGVFDWAAGLVVAA